MGVTVLSIIENILRDVSQPPTTSGEAGLITSGDVLRYLYEAEQEFNNLTLILKASASVQAIADQIEYDLPSNFKTNLYNVEYDYIALTRQSKEFFDLYNSSWHDPSTYADLSLIPKFYTTHLVEEGKFLVWPPPSTSGESQNLRGSGRSFKRTLTFDGTTYNLRGSGGGLKRTLTVNGETINLRTATGGIVRTVAFRKDNLFAEYVKNPETFSLAGYIEKNLEKYQTALEDYCKFRIYERPTNIQDLKLADRFERKFYNKAELAKLNIERARPKHPMGFKPVFRRSQLGSHDIYLSA
jgi:hypothetical protein